MPDLNATSDGLPDFIDLLHYRTQEGFLLDPNPPFFETRLLLPVREQLTGKNATATAQRISPTRCLIHGFLLFLLVSLDVGFCDDIPLMAARSFFDCSSYLFLFLFIFVFKTLCGGEGYENSSGSIRWNRERARRRKNNRRNTRVSFFISSLGLFFPSFLELVGCGWTEEKKEVCTVGFAFRCVCVCVRERVWERER